MLKSIWTYRCGIVATNCLNYQRLQYVTILPYRKRSLFVFLICFYVLFCSSHTLADKLNQPGNKLKDANIVIISIDTLRADALGAYGRAGDPSPNIDRLARHSVQFLNAYAPAPKTAESHMTLFTGLYPSIHKVHTVRFWLKHLRIPKLSPRISTLAEKLKEVGYTTLGFHQGGNVSSEFGFGRGFDIYKTLNFVDEYHWPQVKEHITSRLAGKKFLLFLHSYHIHDPYLPHKRYHSRLESTYRGAIPHDSKVLEQMIVQKQCESIRDCYWSKIDQNSKADIERLRELYQTVLLEVDDRIGELLKLLKKFPRTIIILLSDHGEEFGEHGGLKHLELYQEILRIPLLIHYPGQQVQQQIHTPASLVDIRPTIMDILNLPDDRQIQGASLIPFMKKKEQHRTIFAEYPRGKRWSIIEADRKVMSWNKLPFALDSTTRIESYDLKDDPGEHRNLLKGAGEQDEEKQRATVQLKILHRWDRKNQALADVVLSRKELSTTTLEDSTVNELEALGYLQ